MELASAEIPIPPSPIAADLASGTILRNGTAEIMALGQFSVAGSQYWLLAMLTTENINTKSEMYFMKI
jgi:hypothetical protein